MEVENDPCKLQLLDGGTLGIPHLRTFFLVSKFQEAPEVPEMPTSILPIPPLVNPPDPREAIHLIPPAPCPRSISMLRFSMVRAVRRDVNIISNEALRSSRSNVDLMLSGIAMLSFAKFEIAAEGDDVDDAGETKRGFNVAEVFGANR